MHNHTHGCGAPMQSVCSGTEIDTMPKRANVTSSTHQRNWFFRKIFAKDFPLDRTSGLFAQLFTTFGATLAIAKKISLCLFHKGTHFLLGLVSLERFEPLQHAPIFCSDSTLDPLELRSLHSLSQSMQ